MAFGESARRKLKYLLPAEPPKIHEWGELLAASLDNDVEGGQGTLAERPAAKLRGRLYFVKGDATAANNGILWWDNGTGWERADGTAVTAASVASTYSRVVRVSGEPYEPSSTRPVFVSIQSEANVGTNGTLSVFVQVGEDTIASYTSPFNPSGTVNLEWSTGFVVPPGKTWRAVVGGSGGVSHSLVSHYLVL